MKFFIPFFVIVSINLTCAYGQKVIIERMVDSLSQIKGDTLDCNADLYWRIIAQGDKAIPFLIEKLDDTTNTNIHFVCKTTVLNVAEIAYKALEEIAFFPTAVITHKQFDTFDKTGCWSFYKYFYNNSNKSEYKNNVQAWYNKNRFKPKKIAVKNMTDCRRKYKIFTYYWTS